MSSQDLPWLRSSLQWVPAYFSSICWHQTHSSLHDRRPSNPSCDCPSVKQARTPKPPLAGAHVTQSSQAYLTHLLGLGGSEMSNVVAVTVFLVFFDVLVFELGLSV